MKVSEGDKFDGFMNYKRQFAPEESVVFTWRGDVAEYNFVTKELKMVFEGMSVVPWEQHPEDAVKYLKWLNKCHVHSDYGHEGKWELESVRC
jgi:hypothetical protein